jgi:hypothetical protein
MDKMKRWNIFFNTCMSMGEDDESGPISHPFKQYTRERFPGAIVPPTALEKAAAEAQKQQSMSTDPGAPYKPAPQSVGSMVMIANPAATSSSSSTSTDATSMQYYALQQQQQQHLIQQQQSMAMMYANPSAMQQQYGQQPPQAPGMYYQETEQPSLQSMQQMPPQQQMSQQQLQMQYPGLQGQLGMSSAGQYAGYTPEQSQYLQQQLYQQQQSNPYQYPPYDTSMTQGLPTAMPYGFSADMGQPEPPQLDPHRPTYAQNAIGVEVGKRERMAALLASRRQ